jgi:hypothetical protein
MTPDLTRRRFTQVSAGLLLTTATGTAMTDDTPTPPPFERDYPAPKFQPKFAKPLVDITLARDFVIYAHSDLAMTKQLLTKYPALIHATVDWGGGDFETALGGASHLGQRAIAEYLLAEGARMDIFCAAMLGLVDVVKGMITAAPKLIDAKGPHGFTLHFHAKMGGKDAQDALEYLQSVKKVDFPMPKAKKPE